MSSCVITNTAAAVSASFLPFPRHGRHFHIHQVVDAQRREIGGLLSVSRSGDLQRERQGDEARQQTVPVQRRGGANARHDE